jgi:hypothetical protein
MVPALVRIATATASGIEWFTFINSTPKPAKSILSPAFASLRSALFIPNSASLGRTSPKVSFVPYTGTSNSRKRYGKAPT